MKFAIALCAVLMGIRPTNGAELPTETVKSAQKKRLTTELAELKGYLHEAHQGRRDDSDRYVILHRMLQDYGLLKSTGTIDAQAAILEWRELLKTHPEFKTHPPRLEIREQREARLAEESANAEREEKRLTFIPSDAVPERAFGMGDALILKYQYKIEFYRLPQNLQIASAVDYDRSTNAALNGKIKPFKTMTFKYPIDSGPATSFISSAHPIWFCENLIAGYAPVTNEERNVIGMGIKWTNAAGEYADFCGAVSFNGEVLYRLDVTQRYPDRLLEIKQISPDGKKVVVAQGKAVTEPEDADEEIGNFGQIFIWQFPDNVKVISIEKGRAQKILSDNGLNPWILGY